MEGRRGGGEERRGGGGRSMNTCWGGEGKDLQGPGSLEG